MHDKTDIVWNPSDYQAARIIAEEAGNELLARLQLMTLKPQVIVDVGCGAGEFTQALKGQFPEALVYGIDNHIAMLTSHEITTASPQFIATDALQLPFTDSSVDIITANLFLPWCHDLSAWFAECKRILKPNGLFIFTALGPDTLASFASILKIYPQFVDMHDIGDQLVTAQFADPVLDVTYITLSYALSHKFLAELTATGMIYAEDELENQLTSLQPPPFLATYEIIQGHAWMHADKEFLPEQDGTAFIPLASLRRRLRQG